MVLLNNLTVTGNIACCISGVTRVTARFERSFEAIFSPGGLLSAAWRGMGVPFKLTMVGFSGDCSVCWLTPPPLATPYHFPEVKPCPGHPHRFLQIKCSLQCDEDNGPKKQHTKTKTKKTQPKNTRSKTLRLANCATHTAKDLNDVLDGEGEECHGGGDAPQLRRQAPFDGDRGAAKYTTEC